MSYSSILCTSSDSNKNSERIKICNLIDNKDVNTDVNLGDDKCNVCSGVSAKKDDINQGDKIVSDLSYMRDKLSYYKAAKDIYMVKLNKYTNIIPNEIQNFYKCNNNQKLCITIIIYICIAKKYIWPSIEQDNPCRFLNYNSFQIIKPLKCIRKFSKLFLQQKIERIEDWNPKNPGYKTCNQKLKDMNIYFKDKSCVHDDLQFFWFGTATLYFNYS